MAVSLKVSSILGEGGQHKKNNGDNLPLKDFPKLKNFGCFKNCKLRTGCVKSLSVRSPLRGQGGLCTILDCKQPAPGIILQIWKIKGDSIQTKIRVAILF